MTIILGLMLFAIVGGVLFRLRGSAWLSEFLEDHVNPGFFPTGTTAGRIFWATGMSFMELVVSDSPLFAFIVAIGLFIGAVFGTFHAIDLGTNEGTFLDDYFKLGLRGVLLVIFVAIPGYALMALDWMPRTPLWPMLMLGTTMPVWYTIGHYTMVPKRWATAVGEIGTGAAIGVGLGIAAMGLVR